MQYKFSIVLCLLLLLSFNTSATESKKNISEAEYFKRAFGGSQDLSYAREIDFRLIVEREPIGSISVNIQDPQERSSVNAKVLITSLEPILLPQYYNKLKSLEHMGHITLKHLTALKITPTIDHEKFVLYIHVPVELKKTRDLSISKFQEEQKFPLIPNAPVSGFINARAADTFIMKTRDRVIHNRLPMQANFDGALNLHDYVFEANGSFTERDNKTNWRLGDVRMVHDILPAGIRFSVGDIGYETTTYQSFQKLAGFTFSTNFLSKGIRNTSPSGRYGFLLSQPSTVEVFINEQLVYKRELSAGQYNIQDFPFISGVNDVRIVITDPVGKKEELYFPFFYNYQLLEPGLQNFSYAVGVPTTNVNNKRNFNTSQATFTAFHRIGVTDFLTMGANTQYNNSQYTVGLDGLLESYFGNTHLETAFSRVRHKPKGYATTLQHSKNFGRRNLGIRYQTRTRTFTSLGNLEPNNLDRHEFAISYSFPFVAEIYLGASVSINYDRKFQERTHSHNLTASRQLLPGMQLRGTAIHRRQLNKKHDWVYITSFNFIPPRSNTSYSAEYETEQKNTSLEWDYAPVSPVHSLGANIRHESSPISNDKLDAGLSYNFYRVESRLNVTTQSDHGKYNVYDQRANLQLASGIAYVDGAFGITKPISNSFVMVATQKRLKGYDIDVEPVSDLYHEAQVNSFGPAVIPSLSAYSKRTVSIDDSDFPVGQVLDGNTYSLRPKYKSGAILRIGNNAAVMIQGRLYNKDGEPISKMTMALVPQDKSIDIDKIPHEELFFTGKRGYFAKQGIEPGSYHLVLFNKQGTRFKVTIPESLDGMLDLGTLKAPTKYE